jgi:hypothetical protein
MKKGETYYLLEITETCVLDVATGNKHTRTWLKSSSEEFGVMN